MPEYSAEFSKIILIISIVILVIIAIFIFATVVNRIYKRKSSTIVSLEGESRKEVGTQIIPRPREVFVAISLITTMVGGELV